MTEAIQVNYTIISHDSTPRQATSLMELIDVGSFHGNQRRSGMEEAVETIITYLKFFIMVVIN